MDTSPSGKKSNFDSRFLPAKCQGRSEEAVMFVYDNRGEEFLHPSARLRTSRVDDAENMK